MQRIIPRSSPRETLDVPIQYAPLNTEQFESAHTYDFSADGICYESGRKLEPETEVCIVMENYEPQSNGLEAYRSYVARIRWIHLLSKNGSSRYAAGAQIVARSHEIICSEDKLPQTACDLCGMLTPAHRLCQTDAGISLCRLCSKHLGSIPSEKIRQCVERFLIGNVV